MNATDAQARAIAADLAAVEQELVPARANVDSAWTKYVNQGDEHRPRWQEMQARVAELEARKSRLLELQAAAS